MLSGSLNKTFPSFFETRYIKNSFPGHNTPTALSNNYLWNNVALGLLTVSVVAIYHLQLYHIKGTTVGSL